jgi:hypothetical protein
MASEVSLRPGPRRDNAANIAALLILAVVTGAVLIFRAQPPASAQQFPGQPFHDAAGLFSATTPPGWKVTTGLLDTYPGPVIGPLGTVEEIYTFQDHQAGDSDVAVYIVVGDTDTLDVQAAFCLPTPMFRANTTVDGIPATVSGVPGTGHSGQWWLFQSGDYAFSIESFIPTQPIYPSGDPLSPPPRPIKPLPIPTVTDVSSARAGIQAIVQSLRVTVHGPCYQDLYPSPSP